MAKLHGAAKAAFLKRMAAGRRKAAGHVTRHVKRKVKREIRKTIKRRSPSKSMPRRRQPARRRAPSKRGFASKIPLINNPTFRKAATGIGIATLGVAVLGLVAPQIAQNPIVRPALALLGGGIPGVAAQIFTQGGLGSLGGLSGNGGGSNAGFA